MALFAGDKLGPYEILAPIGAGGMGEVYRAHDGKLNRDVAIKVLPAALARTPVLTRRTILNRIAAINAAHLDADLPLPAAGAARKQLNLIVAHQRPGAPTPSLPVRRTKQDLGGGRDKSP